MSKKRKSPLSRSECICGICRELLLEPVTLPCSHTMCHPCFQLTVEKASLCCPYCRKRVSNWARKNARSGTLVDTELWEIIQRRYPEECERRARGQDTVEDDFEDGIAPYPIPLICKPGEIRQEYEAEINKIKAEQLSREEEESRASEAYIRKLLAEEEEEQRSHLEYLQKQLEEQLKRDEELARTLSSDLNDSTTSEQSFILGIPVVSKQTPSSKSSKYVKAKAKLSGDIERFLSPKTKQSIHSFAQVKSEDFKSINSSVGSNACVSDSEGDSMPTLSPQSSFCIDGIKRQDSDTELSIPCLSKFSPTDAAENGLPLESSSAAKSRVTSKTPSSSAAIDFSPPMSSSGISDCGWGSPSQPRHVTSTPEQRVTTAAKRALESPKDGVCHTADKRQKVMENSSVAGLHVERLMELEETLTQRKIQEEQDRLLALKLQKLLDKEQSTVTRRKGSPDEYELRPKRMSVQQGPSNITPQRMSTDSEEDSIKSGDTADENKKPAPKKSMQQSRNREKHSSSSSSRSQVLKPSNKQQTILDMFQRTTGK